MTLETNKNAELDLPQVTKEVPFDHILKYYGSSFYCRNCGTHNHRYILKGVLKPDSVICDNCGCLTK